MKARNPKFLNTTTKIFGIKITELGLGVLIFYLCQIFISESLIAMGISLITVMILMKLRDYPALHFVNLFLRDDFIKVIEIKETPHE